METHVQIAIAVLLLIIIWFVFTTAEYMINLSSPDKYGNAIAQVVKMGWHFAEFKQLVDDDKFDPTMFDTMLYFQNNNWLSKPNLVKILNADYTGLDQSTANAY